MYLSIWNTKKFHEYILLNNILLEYAITDPIAYLNAKAIKKNLLSLSFTITDLQYCIYINLEQILLLHTHTFDKIWEVIGYSTLTHASWKYKTNVKTLYN